MLKSSVCAGDWLSLCGDEVPKSASLGEDYQEYGLVIPDMMLNDTIIPSESYQMFLKYSTGQIPPKKSRGKGSQGKKTVDASQETVDVFEESEPEPAKRRTTSRSVVKKKVTFFANDNIIPDLGVALELGKFTSINEAEEVEAARQVHATHARIVTESVPEPAKKKTGSRSTKSVVIQDTPSAPKLKPATSKPKLKGTGGSSEGTGRIPGVLDESINVFATSSEGTSTKPGVLDEEKVSTEEKVILEWGSEQESEYSEEDVSEEEEIDWIDYEEDNKKKYDTNDDKSIDLEMTDDEETDDEVLQGKEQVNDDKDEEMLNAKVEDSGKGDAEMSDVAKADAEKIEEAKHDSKKAELPPTSSSLSISLEISSLLDIKIQSEVPHIQSPFVLKVRVFVISEPSILTPLQETPSETLVTTLPPPSVSTIPPTHLQQTTTPIPPPSITTDAPTITTVVLGSDALSVVQLRVTKLEKDVSELKKIDHSAKALATLNALEILKIKKEQAEKQKMPKYTIKSTDKAALKEYDPESALYQTMHENKSFNRNLANHRLYHALMESLIEDENAMDMGVGDTSFKKPSTTKETPKGKASSKGSKTGKSDSAKELVEEPIAEVVMDDTGEDVIRNDDQPQDT
ncbi:hypothetical protein Tco_0025163 [Tanacetum coccineum]